MQLTHLKMSVTLISTLITFVLTNLNILKHANTRKVYPAFRYIYWPFLPANMPYVFLVQSTAQHSSNEWSHPWVLSVESKAKKTLYHSRVHVYLLFGALQAVLFPVVNTRLLPFEVTTYWIQHLLILIVVPFYLVSCQGPYTLEPVWDFTWGTLTLVLFSFYHLLFLQPLAMLIHVNLNHILCPAVSDPFGGPYYRAMACWHQPVMLFLCGKIFCMTGHKLTQFLYGPQDGKLQDKVH